MKPWEVYTSPSVKYAIARPLGVDDRRLKDTYTKPTGGTLTVRFELGGPSIRLSLS